MWCVCGGEALRAHNFVSLRETREHDREFRVHDFTAQPERNKKTNQNPRDWSQEKTREGTTNSKGKMPFKAESGPIRLKIETREGVSKFDRQLE